MELAGVAHRAALSTAMPAQTNGGRSSNPYSLLCRALVSLAGACTLEMLGRCSTEDPPCGVHCTSWLRGWPAAVPSATTPIALVLALVSASDAGGTKACSPGATRFVYVLFHLRHFFRAKPEAPHLESVNPPGPTLGINGMTSSVVEAKHDVIEAKHDVIKAKHDVICLLQFAKSFFPCLLGGAVGGGGAPATA